MGLIENTEGHLTKQVTPSEVGAASQARVIAIFVIERVTVQVLGSGE